jgi:glyoxylase-like metal-dependent hydrolase (beta-lactamase superfamily II)
MTDASAPDRPEPPDRPPAASDWTQPGPVLIAPGVHRIPLPMPSDGLRAVNVYAIDDGDGFTMIDGGWAVPEARTALAKALDELGHGLGDINRILVTHAHRDHYTLAAELRRELRVRVGLGEGERVAIETLNGAKPRSATLIDLVRSAGARTLADQMSGDGSQPGRPAENYDEPDDWIGAGTIRVGDRTLRVVPTPGHTRGHIVFADEPAGLLFAGDHVLPRITPAIGLEPVPSDSPLSDYLDSLALMRTLPDLTLLPAHGPVAPSTHARVDELVAHHDDRLAKTTEAVAGLGAPTAAEVADAIPWTRRHRPFSSLDPGNQMLAVTETVAHLKVLVRTGTLEADGSDPVTYRLRTPPPGMA